MDPSAPSSLSQFCSRVKEVFRKMLGQSDLIYDAAEILTAIDRSRLWEKEAGYVPKETSKSPKRSRRQPEAATNKRKRRPKNHRSKARDEWAGNAFGLSPRQASKYFLIGEVLTRKEVSETGLTLDKLEQVALAVPVLRPVLFSIGTSVSHKAMRYARLLVEADLDRYGSLAEAEAHLKVAALAAEAQKVQERQENQARERRSKEPSWERVKSQVDKAIQELDRLADLPTAKDEEQVALSDLAAKIARLEEKAKALLAKYSPARTEPERRKEPRGAEEDAHTEAKDAHTEAKDAHTEAKDAHTEAKHRKGVEPDNEPLLDEDPWYAPILRAVASLPKDQQALLCSHLEAITTGAFSEAATAMLDGLFEAAQMQRFRVARHYFDHFVAQLLGEDPTTRGLFALELLVGAKLENHAMTLRRLFTYDLPKAVIDKLDQHIDQTFLLNLDPKDQEFLAQGGPEAAQILQAQMLLSRLDEIQEKLASGWRPHRDIQRWIYESVNKLEEMHTRLNLGLLY